MSHYHHLAQRRYNKLFCTALPEATPKLKLWQLAKDYLVSRGLSWETARYNGWFPSESAGDSVPRIVIPATSSNLNNRYWQARALLGGIEPRYQSPLASRGDAVIEVRQAGEGSPLGFGKVVVEGPMDALAAASCGYSGVALMGNRVPSESLALTVELLRGKIAIIIPDSDEINAFISVYSFLLTQGIKCLYLPIKEKEDRKSVV